MKNSNPTKSENITFIGAGIATGFALLQLVEEIKKRKVKVVTKVRVIDKYPEFFCGIPYGKRSSNSVLLINTLESFIPMPQRAAFIDWLNLNKQNLVDEFLENGGIKTRMWVADNQADINLGQWNHLYIPRFFFGKYISEKVKRSVEKCEREGLINLTLTVAEVTDMLKKPDGFDIIMDNGDKFFSNSVVLSIGSLPTRKIFNEETIVKEESFMIFNDIYNKDLVSNIEVIKAFLSNRIGKTSNVLIIGANASGLETLYKFSDNTEIDSLIASYTVLSSHGIIPDSEIDPIKLEKFTPSNLKYLSSEFNVTAKQIADAAYKDLENAQKMNLGAASTVGVISAEIGLNLEKLNEEEAAQFACYHGNNIGRLQRCAGSHYTNVVHDLIKKNRLDHIAGRFSRLITSEKQEDNSLKLEYIDTKTNTLTELPQNIHLVINCMGSTNLKNNDVPALLQNLILKSYIIPNESKIGIQVNDAFEASENLFIAGPLLAGNVLDNKPLWHLEHCGRIIWTSNLLAKKLLNHSLSTKTN